MVRQRTSIALAGALITTLAGCPKQRATPAESGISLRYTVDVSQPTGGWVNVSLEATNLPPGTHRLMRGGNPATTTVKQLVVRAGARALAVRPSAKRQDVWIVETKAGDGPLRASWRARQGGLSRHGHEGLITPSFGLVDGGVFLLPRRYFRQEVKGYAGRSDVARVRVRIKPKAGWQVVSSMRRGADGAFDPDVKGRWKLTHLAHCNIGLGQFDLVERRVGKVLHRIHLFAGWSPKKKKRVASGVLQIARVFDEQAPFVGLPVYTTIFFPAAPDRRPVTGQFWSTGQAYSFDAYEEFSRRIWELYAHRLAHAINRYHVCGFHIDAERERWFVEGWASWTEITHTIKAKVVGSEQRLVKLNRRYRATVLGIQQGVEDRPVFHEARGGYKQLTLYLHYVKGPLVVDQLDRELRRRSDGKKSVNGFIRWVYPRYRGHSKNLPLQRELEAYLGGSVERFFKEHVDRAGFLHPLHAGFLDHVRGQKLSGADAAPALTVDGQTIRARQLRQLRRVLRKMAVDDEAWRGRLVELLLVDREYRARGLAGVPKEMLALGDRLPGSVRMVVFLHQRALLRDKLGGASAYGAWLAKRREAAKIRFFAKGG